MLGDNSDILFDIAHAQSTDLWMETFCKEDGMRKVLETRGEGYDLKRRPYATDEVKKAFIERGKRDGFEGPVCCELLLPPPSNSFVAIYQKSVVGYVLSEGHADMIRAPRV